MAKAPKATAKKRGKAGTSKVSAEKKKLLFVEAMLSNGGNKRQAALAAGFSPTTADKAGQRLAKDGQVMSMLDEAQAEVLNKYRLGTEDVYRSIAQELHFNPKSIYNPDGSLKAITELDDDTAMALAGVEMIQLGTPEAPVFVRKLKWNPRSAAREQLIKILGMYKADNDQTRPDIKVLVIPSKAALDV